MNLSSLDKYESAVKSGGIILADSCLIERQVKRDDATVYYIPATKLANDNGVPTLANIIVMGKLLKELEEYNNESVLATL